MKKCYCLFLCLSLWLQAAQFAAIYAQCSAEGVIAQAGQIIYPRPEPLCNMPIHVLNEGYNTAPNFTQWHVLTTTDSLIYAVSTNAYFNQGVLTDTSLLWGLNLHNAALPPQPGLTIQTLTNNTDFECIHLTQPVMVMPAVALPYYYYPSEASYQYTFQPVCAVADPNGHVIKAHFEFTDEQYMFFLFNYWQAANFFYLFDTQEKLQTTYANLKYESYPYWEESNPISFDFFLADTSQAFSEGDIFIELKLNTNYGLPFPTPCSCLHIVNIPPASNCTLQVSPNCSYPGAMPADTVVVCHNQPEWIQTTDPVLAEGDVLAYVIHTNSGLEIGEVKGINTSGVLEYSYLNNAQYYTQYYVSAVTGPDENGDGLPDFDHPCTFSNAGTPIIFAEPVQLLYDIYTSYSPIENCTYAFHWTLYVHVLSFTGNTTAFPITISSDIINTTITNGSTVSTTVIFPDPASLINGYDITISNKYGCISNIYVPVYVPSPIGYAVSFLGMDHTTTQILCPQDSIQVQINCVISNQFYENHDISDQYDVQYFLTTAPYYNPAVYPIISANSTGVFYAQDVPAAYHNTLLYIIAADPNYTHYYFNEYYYNDWGPYFSIGMNIGMQKAVFLSPIQATAQVFSADLTANEFYLSLAVSGGATQYAQSGAYELCNTDSLLTWDPLTQNATVTLGPYPMDSLTGFQLPDLCLTEQNPTCFAQAVQVPITCCDLLIQPDCSYPGAMPADTVFVCHNSFSSVQTQGAILKDQDLLVYVLHTNSGLSLGTTLAYNTTGSFNATQISGINPNQTYFISALTGPDVNADQFPDADNPCTQLTMGTPVIFLSDIVFFIDYGELTEVQFFNCGVLRTFGYLVAVSANQNQFPISITSSGYLPDTVFYQTNSYFTTITYDLYQQPYPIITLTLTGQYGCTKTITHFYDIIYEATPYALFGMPKDTLLVCPQDSAAVQVTCFLSRDGNVTQWEEVIGSQVQYFLTTAPVYNPTLYPILAANTTGVFNAGQAIGYLNTPLYIVATDPEFEPNEYLEYDFIQEDYTPIVFLAPIQATAQAIIEPTQPSVFTLSISLSGGSPAYLQQGGYHVCSADTLFAEWNNEAQNATFTLGPYPIQLLPDYTNLSLCVQDSLNGCQTTELNLPVEPPCPLALQSALSHCAQNNPLVLSDLFTPPGGSFLGTNVQSNLFAPDSAGIYTISYCYENCCANVVIAVNNNAGSAGTDNYLNTCIADMPMIDLALLLTNAQNGGVWQISPTSGCQPPDGSFFEAQGIFYPPQNDTCTYCFYYTVSLAECPDEVAQICIETVLPPLLLPEQTLYIMPNDTLTLSVTNNAEGLSFYWSNGATTATIQVTLPDTAVYTVTVTNATNCTAQTTITLLPDPSIGIAAPANMLAQGYHIFPNPTQNDLFVALPAGIGHCKASIYDLSGKLLLQNILTATQNYLLVAHLPNGCYLLQLTDVNGSAAFRFIVAK